mgnify:CR=1 FL=1
MGLGTIDPLLAAALREDIGTGDVTTLSTVPKDTMTSGRFIVKEAGVVCGLPVAARVFSLVDPEIEFTPACEDGDAVNKGDVIAEITGPARGILTGERVALNFLQHLSGIATHTRRCA